ncbi:fumarylacetoacetate hydrolase family protein [Bradyrhizobium manausense]
MLLAAYQSKQQATQISKIFPDVTFEDAYEISAELNRRRLASGSKLIGYKVGLTSKAMQRSSKIEEPDYGYLLEEMLIPEGGAVPRKQYCVPRVEAELAFVLGSSLKGPGVRLVDALRATEYVIPAIEVVDARIQDPRSIFDTISDNGASAGIVLGGRPVKPQEVDLRWSGCILHKNGEVEETGLAAGVLGHPAMGVAWLANKLGSFGIAMTPGQTILTGSFIRVAFAEQGDVFHADFGQLGSVALRFT